MTQRIHPLAFAAIAAVATLGAALALALDPAPAPAAPAGAVPTPAAPVEAPVGALAKPEDLLARFPPVIVVPRKEALAEKGSYPCSECHDESMAPDPRERALTEAHDDIQLVHGGGRMWCTTCHHDDKGQLKSLKGAAIDFDQSFLLCGECHFREQREFFHGAHGKRVSGWNQPRKVLNCTACHDAHDPSIKPRQPWRVKAAAPTISNPATITNGAAPASPEGGGDAR